MSIDPKDFDMPVASFNPNPMKLGLFTDGLPAIALGMEAVESDVMSQKPRSKKESLFAHGLGVRIVLQGCMFAILSLIAFWIGCDLDGNLAQGQTMAFIVLSVSQILQAYNMRSDHSLFTIGVFTNRKLNVAALLSLALVALVVLTPVGILFEMASLPLHLYAAALGLALIPTVVMEVSKRFGLIKHAH